MKGNRGIWLAPFAGVRPRGKSRMWKAGRPDSGRAAKSSSRRMEGKPSMEGRNGFIYRVRPDGTGARKALAEPILLVGDVSPDGRWLLSWAPLHGNGPQPTRSFHLTEGLRSLWVRSTSIGRPMAVPWRFGRIRGHHSRGPDLSRPPAARPRSAANPGRRISFRRGNRPPAGSAQDRRRCGQAGAVSRRVCVQSRHRPTEPVPDPCPMNLMAGATA